MSLRIFGIISGKKSIYYFSAIGMEKGSVEKRIEPQPKGKRFEVSGHVIGESFNPGDYYDTDKPGYFLRWQLEMKLWADVPSCPGIAARICA